MTKMLHVMTPRKKKDGSTFWMRIGTAFDGEKGIGIEFDALPIADSEGRCTVRLFEPRNNDRPQVTSGRQSTSELIDDDLAF